MKILLVTPFYAIHEKLNLTEDNRAIHYFTKEWVNQGHDVNVLSTYFNSVNSLNNCKNMLRSFVRSEYSYFIDNVQTNLMIINKFNTGLPKINSFQVKKLYHKIMKNINNIDALVFHFPSIYTDIIKLLLDTHSKKISIVYHTLDIKNINIDVNKQVQLKLINDKVKKIGFRSNRIKKDFSMVYKNKYLEKSFLVHSGVSRDRIIKPEEKRIGNFKETLRFLFVGKLIKRKNAEKVMMALKQFDEKYNFELVFIGSGPEYSSLLKKKTELNFKNNVTFLGKIPRDEVFGQMFKSDFFLLPSYHETLGLVYLEAMSQGCITIGTKNEGIDGIIKNGKNGFLVDLNKEQDIVTIVRKVFYLSLSERKKIITNSIETVKKYTNDKVSRHYLFEIIQ